MSVVSQYSACGPLDGTKIMTLPQALVERVRSSIDVDRLVATAVALVEAPSPTRSAKPAADRLAAILTEDGLEVERPEADWPESPAVVARLKSGRPGRTLQFNGHLDTVHLPFVPPRVENGVIHGSGAADMKGGIAAMCAAARALRDTGALPGGEILITAADHHEAPWGDQRQLKALIEAGYMGDGVLIPEYVFDCLPVMGRGMAILDVLITREGPPLHEVRGGLEQPSVIAAGADLVQRFEQLDQQLAEITHPFGDRESVFVGSTHSGEIYNQSPTEFQLRGTRRWLPGTDRRDVEQQYRDLLDAVGRRAGITVDGRFNFLADPFELDQGHALIPAFQTAHAAVTGTELPLGSKPFLDDGNFITARRNVPAITHGPNAKGAHTLEEAVEISELARVALVYALTAVCFCRGDDD